MTASKLSSFDRSALSQALRKGQVNLHLGPFVIALQSPRSEVVHHLHDLYRDVPATLGIAELTDYSLKVDAPNWLRRYIRPHILPDPGFHFPAAPLPVPMAPLALEMGMNLCVALQCFRYVIFHAGVVARGDQAILLAAQSGGGKSTLTAALMEQGFRLMSDEFGILSTEEALLNAYPRPVSLKNESIDIVSDFAGTDALSQRLKDTPKGDIAYRRARASDISAMAQPAKASLILFPRFQPGAVRNATRVETAEAAMSLIASSPNYDVIGEPAFLALVKLLDGARCFELTYDNTADSIQLVEDLLSEGGS